MKIIEFPELQRLEKAVDETASTVAEWKGTVAQITTQFNTATLARDNATKVRATFALKAAMHDAHAVSEVENARSVQAGAEQTIADLAVALPAAEAELAVAEKNAAGARRAVAKLKAEGLMKERIIVAGKIDLAIADFTRLFNEFEKLGHEIVNSGVLPQQNMFGSANHDGAIGLRRMRAALPKFFDRVYPNSLHDENTKENLSTSEARHWNLAPIESETKAA
jgi:hypothetical protein